MTTPTHAGSLCHLFFGMLSVLVCILPPLRAADLPSPVQAYTAVATKPVTHDVELVVTVTAPYKTNLLRVWMPVPQSDNVQEVVHSEMTTFPVEIAPQVAAESVFGNKFAYFEFPNPQGAMVIRHKLRIKVSELHWDIDPNKVQTVSAWPDGFAPYLRGEEQAVVMDGRFEKLLADIVPKPSNPVRDLRTVMDYVDTAFTYDHRKASLRASSAHALELKTGHCSDYHGFCAAMGRLMKVPTRVTYGINTFPKASPSHCKLEAFLPPYGWVSFDVSETQKLVSLIRNDATLDDESKERLVSSARARLMSGFRDNTWFKQTQGTDYDLAPKAQNRVPVVRTIYAEADGVALADPDPSAAGETKFSWMTAQRFDSAPPVKNPFADPASLRQ